MNDAEGLNPSGFRIRSKTSAAREDKAANVISLLPTVQDRGAQPASHVKWSPKRNSGKHSIQLILSDHTTNLPLSWSIQQFHSRIGNMINIFATILK